MATTKNPSLHLLGPTSVGKGFTTHKLERALKLRHGVQIGIVCVGDEIRHRFATDPDFRRTYEPIVAQGDLVADHEILPMFDNRVRVVSDELLVATDGFFRNPTQVAHAEKNGLLKRGSACVIMHASKGTCHARLVHRMEQKPNGKRIDEHAFEKRYHFHQDSILQIQAALVHSGTRILHIDANGDLEQDVFPQMLTFAECVLFRYFEHDVTNLMQEAFTQHLNRLQQPQMATA